MASNIRAKNTIASFKKFEDMPYQSPGNIDYGPGRSYIDSIALNNTFN